MLNRLQRRCQKPAANCGPRLVAMVFGRAWRRIICSTNRSAGARSARIHGGTEGDEVAGFGEPVDHDPNSVVWRYTQDMG